MLPEAEHLWFRVLCSGPTLEIFVVVAKKSKWTKPADDCKVGGSSKMKRDMRCDRCVRGTWNEVKTNQAETGGGCHNEKWSGEDSGDRSKRGILASMYLSIICTRAPYERTWQWNQLEESQQVGHMRQYTQARRAEQGPVS